MLFGRTTMTIQQETLKQALQEYLDRTFAAGKAPQVASIGQMRGSSYDLIDRFEVLLDGPAQPGIAHLEGAKVEPA